MAQRGEIDAYLHQVLQVDRFKDYGPNGLQVEGKPEIRKIVSGVTASLALIEAAVEQGADALLVPWLEGVVRWHHHGPDPLTTCSRSPRNSVTDPQIGRAHV